MSLDELEEMRKENEERLKQLEEVYYKKKVNANVGKAIREKMGFTMDDEGGYMSSGRKEQQEEETFGMEDGKSDKKKKSVRIVGEEEPRQFFGVKGTSDGNREMSTAHYGGPRRS